MKIFKKMKMEKGQSLFEVVFAVGVMAIVLVGVISLAAKSVRTSTFSNSNAIATKYAQEAIEWLRKQRDDGWSNLSSRIGTTCLSSNPLSTWGGSGSCPITGDTYFNRRVILTSISASSIDAAVEVSWSDSSGTHTVRSVTKFTNWNK